MTFELTMADLAKTVVTALFTGLGSGIGSYLATKYAIAHIENLKEHIKKRTLQNGNNVKRRRK